MKKKLLLLVTCFTGVILESEAQNLWDVSDTGTHTYTASSSNAMAAYAWDNNPKTIWSSTTSPSSNAPVTNTVHLASAKIITGYSVSAPSDNSQSPQNWTLQGSNDGSTWVTLDTRTNLVWGEQASTKIFSFVNSTSYAYYELRFTKSEGSKVGVSELQLFTAVALTGKVFVESGSVPTPYVMNSGDVALPQVTVSLVNESGAVFATSVTDASGSYGFTTVQLTGENRLLEGDFSVVVTPPKGYVFSHELNQTYTQLASSTPSNSTPKDIDRYLKVADGVFPFLSYVYTNPSKYSFYTVSNSRWDFGQNVSNADHSGRGANLAVNSIDFGLQKAAVTDFSQFYPAGYTALPDNLITVENNGTFGTYTPTSYAVAHPNTPRFDWFTSKNFIYTAFSNPSSGTAYTFKSTPSVDRSYPGTLINEGAYTVTNFLGTIQADVSSPVKVGSGSPNSGGNLLNSYAGGWRKTYGANTGDVYDQFVAINGSTVAGAKILQTNTFTLTSGTKYAVFFNAKSANSSQQGGTSDSQLIVKVYRSGSTTPVNTQAITLKAPTSIANDAPATEWEFKYSEYTPTSTGTYYVVVEASTDQVYGNDFYFDNLGFYELKNKISISGTVWNDIDNSANGGFTTIKTNSETGTNAGQLYAYLIDSNHKIVDVATVAANGTYTFENAPVHTNGLTIAISSEQLSATQIFTTSKLSSAWTNTSPLRTSGFDTGTATITGKDFGIEQLPESAISVLDGGLNPGGNLNMIIPTSAFQHSTMANPNTSDFSSGAVTQIRITAFPVDATSITIGTTTYTAGNWPATGVSIPYIHGIGPALDISIDPAETAATSVIVEFAAVDNAGKEDPTPGSVTIHFTSPTYSIKGSVYDDANGLLGLPANTVDGIGTNIGGQLVVSLVNDNGTVLETQAVASNGSYAFNQVVPGNYTLVLGTVAGVTPALPTNWVNTGENLGASAGTDQLTDGKLSVMVTTQNIVQANFGIEQLPYATTTTMTGGLNPGGVKTYSVPGGAFQTSNTGGTPTSDTDGQVKFIRITNFPTGAASITIGNTEYTSTTWPAAGVTVSYTNGSGPSQSISVDPAAEGKTEVVIPFVSIDDAGKSSMSPGSVKIEFVEAPTPVTLATFATKLKDGSVAITWQTASEWNVSHFEVQRSINALDFESIGYTKSLGNTTKGFAYALTDNVLPEGSSVLYYRLKILDQDGSVAYSKVSSVEVNDRSKALAWPSPFSDQYKIRIPVKQAGVAQVRMMNAAGMVVWHSQWSVTAGIQVLDVKPEYNLPTGLYLIHVSIDGEKVLATKIIKQ